MAQADIMKVLSEAKPRIAQHWDACLKAKLSGHTPARQMKVDQALEAYVAALGGLKGGSPKDGILAAMKSLFETLDEVNEDAGGGLLETDERELLVPVLTDAAVAAGLNLSEFKDGDPTFQFRNF